jgi:hypothetical protein
MLHWQHKSARKRLSLWFKLILISLTGHIVALAMLFFVYRGSTLDMALTVRAAQLNSTIDVVWVLDRPYFASYSAKASKDRKASKGGQGERKKKVAVPKNSKSSDPKTELKSEVEEKKRKLNPSHAQGERNKKKAEDKIQNKKLEKAKAEEKKPEIKKPEPEKKPEIEKLDPEPEKKMEPIKQVDPPSVRPERAKDCIESTVDSLVDHPESDSEDLNFEISGSYRDLEALQQFQELQQEISRCWRPPIGIAQTVCCQIKVAFDWEGKVAQMETVKPSGILMFDVSSRNAVAAMEAPKFVRGKTFTITFKP